MRVACARRNESQASSPLALASSRATSRSRRPATLDFDCTCTCNIQSVECLHSQVYAEALRRTVTTTEHRPFALPTWSPDLEGAVSPRVGGGGRGRHGRNA